MATQAPHAAGSRYPFPRLYLFDASYDVRTVPRGGGRDTHGCGARFNAVIDRRQFTPNGEDPPYPIPLNDLCTVPTSEMAYLLADCLGECKDVLEIGTGSGFQCAVLAERFRSVVSIECEPNPVAHKLPDHVALIVGNGYEFDTGEEFDGVLVTFAASSISPVWAKQVRLGGRLVIPLQIGSCCRISVYQRDENGLRLIDTMGYAPFTEGVKKA